MSSEINDTFAVSRARRIIQPLVALGERFPFLRSVAILAGGTALAQSLTIAVSPVISRLYTPEDLGILSVFISIASILSAVAGGRYELAIPLPHDEKEAMNLLALSLSMLVICSLAVVLVAFTCGDFLLTALGSQQIIPFIPWLPLGVLGLGFYQAVSYWPVRQKTYGLLARTKLTQSIGQVLVQVGSGLLSFGPGGLIAGDIVGRSSGGFSLLRAIRRAEPSIFSVISVRLMRSVARRYRKFPLLTSWSTLLWILGTAGVPVILNGFYGARVAGLVGLVQLLVGTPMALLSTSTTKVFVGEAAKLHRSKSADLRPLFWDTLRQMTYILLPLITAVAVTAPWVIPLVYGGQWQESALYLQLLAPMFLISTICLPTLGVLNVFERQDLQLVCDVFRIPLMLGSLMLGGVLGLGPAWSLLIYSFASSLYYIGNTAVAFFVVRSARPSLADSPQPGLFEE